MELIASLSCWHPDFCHLPFAEGSHPPSLQAVHQDGLPRQVNPFPFLPFSFLFDGNETEGKGVEGIVCAKPRVLEALLGKPGRRWGAS